MENAEIGNILQNRTAVGIAARRAGCLIHSNLVTLFEELTRSLARMDDDYSHLGFGEQHDATTDSYIGP